MIVALLGLGLSLVCGIVLFWTLFGRRNREGDRARRTPKLNPPSPRAVTGVRSMKVGPLPPVVHSAEITDVTRLAHDSRSRPNVPQLPMTTGTLEITPSQPSGLSRKLELHWDTTHPSMRLPISAPLKLRAAGKSDPGTRRTRNEDAIIMLEEHSTYAVADGMGADDNGEVASRVAIDTLRRCLTTNNFEGTVRNESVPITGDELARAFRLANSAVHALIRKTRDRHAGTTLVAARFSLESHNVYIAHVGDSRCYRFRDDDLHQLTTDHILVAGAKDGPGASLGRALGLHSSLTIELIADIPRVGDVYLLCTDGLTKAVSDEAIRAVLRETGDLVRIIDTLIRNANERGGSDNVTAIVVRVHSGQDFEPPTTVGRIRFEA